MDSIATGQRSASTCAFVNTSTNASFSGIPKTGVVGTLVRNSHLVELKTARELVPAEYWLLQGYVPDIPGVTSGSVFAGLFPQPWLDFNLPEVSELTGNGMHMAAVSATLLFALGTGRPAAPDTSE